MITRRRPILGRFEWFLIGSILTSLLDGNLLAWHVGQSWQWVAVGLLVVATWVTLWQDGRDSRRAQAERAGNPPNHVSVDVEDLVKVLDQRVGHSHSRAGIWDDDNAPGLAGTRCAECAARARLRAALVTR